MEPVAAGRAANGVRPADELHLALLARRGRAHAREMVIIETRHLHVAEPAAAFLPGHELKAHSRQPPRKVGARAHPVPCGQVA